MGARRFYAKVMVGFLMSFLVMLGDITSNTLNNSLIFNRLGSDAFGFFTFFKAVSVIIASGITAALAPRVPRLKLLLGFMAVITLMSLGGTLLLADHLHLALGLLVAAEGALLVGFNFTLWPLLNEIFPVLTRKKAFPMISAGAGVAGVVAGVLVAETLKRFGTSSLAGAFTAMVGGVVFLALGLGMLANGKNIKPAAIEDLAEQRPGFVQGLRALPKVFSDVPFLRWLFAFNLLAWVTYRLVDYQFNLQLKAMSPSEERFGEILGYCYSGVNAFIVIYQFGLARLVLTHIGLTRLIAIYPALMVLISLASLVTGHPMLVFANRACAELLICTVILGAMALAYNVVANGLRASAQALIDGLGASVGTMLGSAMLMGLAGVVAHGQGIVSTSLVLVTTAGALIAAVLLGREFIFKALENLDSGDQQLILNSVQALQERGHSQAIAKLLQVSFNDSGRYDAVTSATAIRTLSQLRHRMMPNLFLRMLSDEDPRRMLFAFNMLQDFYLSEVRSNFILRQKVLNTVEKVTIKTAAGDDSLNAVYNRAIRLYFKIAYPQALCVFLDSALDSGHPRLIANTIEALTYLENKYSYLYIEKLQNHPNNRVRSTAIVELWKLREDKDPLVFGLRRMLSETDLSGRISAIWAIGRIAAPELAQFLLPYLKPNVARELRIHAINALLRLPYAFAQKTLASTNLDIRDIYRALLKELTDRSQPERARRSIHFAMGMHRSHISRLDACVISMDLPVDGMNFLHHHLLEQGADAKPLLRFVERFVGATPANAPPDGSTDQDLAV